MRQNYSGDLTFPPNNAGRPRGAGDRLGRILDLQEQAFADRAVRIKRLSNDFDRLLLDISAVLNR